jgi:hypothetical protein
VERGGADRVKKKDKALRFRFVLYRVALGRWEGSTGNRDPGESDEREREERERFDLKLGFSCNLRILGQNLKTFSCN